MTRVLSVSEINELLRYDEKTGRLYWRVDIPGRNKKAGESAESPHNYCYMIVQHYQKHVLSHRAAWVLYYGDFPRAGLDHINLNRSDNRIGNLREASTSQNGANTRLRSHSKTGFKGVQNNKGRFRARISVGTKKIHLGYFDTPELAHEAYAVAARMHYGEFARLR